MDVLLYIKRDQVDGVFRRGDVGSGSTSFAGMSKEADRVFVASWTPKGVAVVGEIPIDETYPDKNQRKGWRYRVRAVERQHKRYSDPVVLDDLQGKLEFTRKAGKAWPLVRYPMRLSQEDAEMISRHGKKRSGRDLAEGNK